MRFILGVDEAGRGPLAGPVAVGVVAVPEGFDVAREFPGVADSKKVSPKKRERIFEMLEARAAQGDARFIVEFESAGAIDEEGIAVVIRRALACGVERLVHGVGFTKSDMQAGTVHVMLDGALRAPPEYSQETIIHGDALVPIISLASIAAKVERDRLMVALAAEYPEYGFETHKGYGTSAHYAALLKYGLCAVHRRSFIHLDLLDK
ncbi:MAG: ribonuclease HII [Minisyncoccota bacterium]